MRVKNEAAGFYDSTGFHPIRGSSDYDADRAGDEYSERRPKAKRKKKATGRKAKPKAKAHRKRTAKAVGRKRNPIPVKWATAKVRKLGNDIQVMLFPKGKVAKRGTKRRVNPSGRYARKEGYYVGSGGSHHRLLKAANAEAKRISASHGYVSVESEATGKIISAFRNGYKVKR